MMVEMLSRYLLSPALLGLGSGRVLSWWFGCLRLFAILWFRVLWASASVVEVTTVPTLRWLLTLGLISLVLFIFFVSILSRLSLTRRTPAESWSVTSIHVLPDWSALFSCTLVVSTLHYLSLHGRVGILWSTPVGPTHVVRWVPPPAIGTALLGLAFRDVLCSFVLLPTLTVLVVLLVVAWRTPATRISSVMVTVCCVFAALHWNATRPCHIRCLRTLLSFNHIKLHGLSISYAAEVLPGVILLYGSLMDKHIFLGVIPVDEAVTVPYVEPFHCSQNLRCDDLLVPAGGRRRRGQAAAPVPAAAVRFGVGGGGGGGRRGDGGGGRLGLGLAAHGGGCSVRTVVVTGCLRRLPRCDGD